MLKKKKRFLGFSLLEVVISVSILALIISTMGMSFIGIQKLRLSAQIRADVEKIGNTLLDNLSSLPLRDSYVSTNEGFSNDVLSLRDLWGNNNDRDRNAIINTLNNTLDSLCRGNGFLLISPGQQNIGTKGAIVRFDDNNNDGSKVRLSSFNQQNQNQANSQVYKIEIQLRFVDSRRRTKTLTFSRIIVN